MAKFDNLCRSCKHYDIAAVRNSAGAVLRNRTARCNWKPETPLAFPASLDWAVKDAIKRLEEGRGCRWTEPNEGSDCKVWERAE